MPAIVASLMKELWVFVDVDTRMCVLRFVQAPKYHTFLSLLYCFSCKTFWLMFMKSSLRIVNSLWGFYLQHNWGLWKKIIYKMVSKEMFAVWQNMFHLLSDTTHTGEALTNISWYFFYIHSIFYCWVSYWAWWYLKCDWLRLWGLKFVSVFVCLVMHWIFWNSPFPLLFRGNYIQWMPQLSFSKRSSVTTNCQISWFLKPIGWSNSEFSSEARFGQVWLTLNQ